MHDRIVAGARQSASPAGADILQQREFLTAVGSEIDSDRMAAFSDGVLAIVITIMVLELGIPEGASLAALKSLVPVLLSYVLSFIYVGIYWNNHHHLLHAVERVNGTVL